MILAEEQPTKLSLWRIRSVEKTNKISREKLKEKIESKDDFDLVEVLSKKEFEEYHLPQSINIPFHQDNFEQQAEKYLRDKFRTTA